MSVGWGDGFGGVGAGGAADGGGSLPILMWNHPRGGPVALGILSPFMSVSVSFSLYLCVCM